MRGNSVSRRRCDGDPTFRDQPRGNDSRGSERTDDEQTGKEEKRRSFVVVVERRDELSERSIVALYFVSSYNLITKHANNDHLFLGAMQNMTIV